MKPKIIILLGWSGAGKDTVFKGLKSLNYYDYSKVSFVRPLKKLLEDSFGLPVCSLDSPEYKGQILPGTEITYLDFLIQAGLNGGAFTQLWPLFAKHRIQKLISMGMTPVLTDMRFPQELEMVLSLSDLATIHPFQILSPFAAKRDSDHWNAQLVSTFKSKGIQVPHIWNDRTRTPQKLAEIVLENLW